MLDTKRLVADLPAIAAFLGILVLGVAAVGLAGMIVMFSTMVAYAILLQQRDPTFLLGLVGFDVILLYLLARLLPTFIRLKKELWR